MRTAKEMKKNCAKSGFGRGIGPWGIFDCGISRRSFRKLESNLTSNEEVLIAFMGRRTAGEVKDAKKKSHSHHYVFAVTNKRLIVARKFFWTFRTSFYSVNLDNLNDISIKSHIISTYITIDTTKEVFTIKMFSNRARKLFKVLNEQLSDFKKRAEYPVSPVKPSAADELLKYKQLLDQGAITQDEYDKAKQKLLA